MPKINEKLVHFLVGQEMKRTERLANLMVQELKSQQDKNREMLLKVTNGDTTDEKIKAWKACLSQSGINIK